MAKNEKRIIAIANEKGGVGKTVTVINLAAALTLSDKSVLVVDMDPQGNATSGLGLSLSDNGYSSYHLLINEEEVHPKETIVETKWKGLSVIPSHVDLAGSELELVDKPGRENLLKESLAAIADEFDFVLIDTPPSLSLLTVNVFSCAKEVIVPCQTHPYAFNALDELFDTMDSVKSEINPNLIIAGIVATFFDKRTRVSQSIIEKLKTDERYCELLFETKIRINTTIADSAAVQKPVIFYRRSSYGGKDYLALAEEVLNQ